MVQYQNGLVDRIQTVLAATLNVDASEITAETQFGDLPQWDSMGHMEVLVALEKEFGVEVTADTITNLISVPAICHYIEGNSHV
jgi:acyl carrier protein